MATTQEHRIMPRRITRLGLKKAISVPHDAKDSEQLLSAGSSEKCRGKVKRCLHLDSDVAAEAGSNRLGSEVLPVPEFEASKKVKVEPSGALQLQEPVPGVLRANLGRPPAEFVEVKVELALPPGGGGDAERPVKVIPFNGGAPTADLASSASNMGTQSQWRQSSCDDESCEHVSLRERAAGTSASIRRERVVKKEADGSEASCHVGVRGASERGAREAVNTRAKVKEEITGATRVALKQAAGPPPRGRGKDMHTKTVKVEGLEGLAEDEVPLSRQRERRRRPESGAADKGSASSKREKKKRAGRAEGCQEAELALVPVGSAGDILAAVTSETAVQEVLGPYPGHSWPTPEECYEVVSLLSALHGPVERAHFRACPTLEPGEHPERPSPSEEKDGRSASQPPFLQPTSATVEGTGNGLPGGDQEGRPRRRKGVAVASAVAAVGTTLAVVPVPGDMVSRRGGVQQAGAAAAVAAGARPLTVLDSLIRTLLSQNTTDTNSRRAFAALKAAFPTWEEVYAAEDGQLAAAIRCGGLAEIKAGRIRDILETLMRERGHLGLEHLEGLSSHDIKAELSRFKGVGPKTVACVLMFHLHREEFPVDTHVFHIAKRLGWVPPAADREKTYLHLNQRVPDDAKFSLHCLLVTHGKRCPQCSKGKRTQRTPDGACPLVGWEKVRHKLLLGDA